MIPAVEKVIDIEIASEGDRTLVLLSKMAKCTCGRPAVLFVNRAGRSRCVSCDYLFTETQAPETLVPAEEAQQ